MTTARIGYYDDESRSRKNNNQWKKNNWKKKKQLRKNSNIGGRFQQCILWVALCFVLALSQIPNSTRTINPYQGSSVSSGISFNSNTDAGFPSTDHHQHHQHQHHQQQQQQQQQSIRTRNKSDSGKKESIYPRHDESNDCDKVDSQWIVLTPIQDKEGIQFMLKDSNDVPEPFRDNWCVVVVPSIDLSLLCSFPSSTTTTPSNKDTQLHEVADRNRRSDVSVSIQVINKLHIVSVSIHQQNDIPDDTAKAQSFLSHDQSGDTDGRHHDSKNHSTNSTELILKEFVEKTVNLLSSSSYCSSSSSSSSHSHTVPIQSAVGHLFAISKKAIAITDMDWLVFFNVRYNKKASQQKQPQQQTENEFLYPFLRTSEKNSFDHVIAAASTKRPTTELTQQMAVTTSVNTILVGPSIFSPLHLLGIKRDWPPGFPFPHKVNNDTTISFGALHGRVAYHEPEMNVIDEIGIIQHHTTEAVASSNKGNAAADDSTSKEHSRLPIVVPDHAFVPYYHHNHHHLTASHLNHTIFGSTTHTCKAFWALLLPLSLPEDISDLWRGYIAQTLLRNLGLKVVMTSPSSSELEISRGGDGESLTSNMSSPKHIVTPYWVKRTVQILKFLDSWDSTSTDLYRRIIDLWGSLSIEGFLHDYDVSVVKIWVELLKQTGYDLPTISRQKLRDTVVQGQFNYANPLDDVLMFHQKYRQLFDRVVVRGPFPEYQLFELRKHGIDAYQGSNDEGFFSPMENLRRTLLQFETVPDVNGVLYVHDDLFLNLTSVLPPSHRGKTIVTTLDDVEDPRIGLDDPERLKHVRKFNYYMKLEDCTSEEEFLMSASSIDITISEENAMNMTRCPKTIFLKPHATKSDEVTGPSRFNSFEEMEETMAKWMWGKDVATSYERFLRDERSRPFLEDNGSFLVPRKGYCDMLYVPTRYASEFAGISSLMTDHKVFLESSCPKIIDLLLRRNRLSTPTATSISMTTQTASSAQEGPPLVHTVPVYAPYKKSVRNTLRMFSDGPFPAHVIHPFKLSNGLRLWSKSFDWITGSTRGFQRSRFFSSDVPVHNKTSRDNDAL